MIMRNRKTPGPDGLTQESSDGRAGADHDETCRCKETSAMTPRELLRHMMRDLTFWKKEKKRQPGE